jgi:hydroxymethylglutaryl-CoA reductase (NADPH)
LRATPEQIHNLNIKKNLLGTNIAGAVRTANAHFANMLLAIYLATGQDAANIVEGSQGFVTTDIVDDHLYFSVTLPNLIIGTVGNGKELAFVQENLQSMGCLGAEGADKLAIITAATVLCGELSLLAAQTNPGELLRTHMLMERRPQNVKV